MSLIDIGVNLTNSRFDADRAQVIKAAHDAGVASMLITGTSPQESQQAFELTQDYPELYSTAGCHPHDAKDLTAQGFKQIKELLRQSAVVAVGECGLDFNRNYSPQDVQISVFEQQLGLACEIQKPLFLHERDASVQMLKLLQAYPKRPNTVIHCFTGAQATLEAYLELGCSIGITGWICDERRGKELAEMVSIIPDDKLMLETDAPYLIPRTIRPRPKSSRNLPSYLPHVAEKVAQVRNQSIEQIIQITSQNTQAFFGITL